MTGKWTCTYARLLNQLPHYLFFWLNKFKRLLDIFLVNPQFFDNRQKPLSGSIQQLDAEIRVHTATWRLMLKLMRVMVSNHAVALDFPEFFWKTLTSSKCPLHGHNRGKRIKRGLFKCTTLNKVFNADLVGAYNILITPSPERGNGPETRPGAKPSKRGDVAPNLPALA